MPGASKPATTGAGGAKSGAPAYARFLDDKRAKVYEILSHATDDGLSMRYNCVCLSLISVLLLGLGLALLVVGPVKDIEDLIILGALFVFGGLVFAAMFGSFVCRPLCRKSTVGVDNDYIEPDAKRPNDDDFYVTLQDDDLAHAKDKPAPSNRQLYGAGSGKSTPLPPATPATATDVNIHAEADTPPPPRVVMPNDPMVSRKPVYTARIERTNTSVSQDGVRDLDLL